MNMLTMPAQGEPLPPHGDSVMAPSCAERLLGMTDDELGRIDPLVMNLLVAKGIPSLQDLDISRYQRMADDWADDIRGYLPAGDANFHRNPELFRHDIRFGRLALACWYIGSRLDMRYREDQRHVKAVLYTDPSDLFLNGVMDSHRGTCGNLSMVFVILAWRLGWPVSLASVGSHFISRYDDGDVRYNIEATNLEGDTFSSQDDEYYLKLYNLPEKAIRCGSDLRAVTPRELLGTFFGLRGRHYENTDRFENAEVDYLLARYLFPKNRSLHISQHQRMVQYGIDLFEPGEKGHPVELADWLQEVVRVRGWTQHKPQPPKEVPNSAVIDSYFGSPDFQ